MTLQEWMEDAGLKPADVAQELGVHVSSVSRWLNGHRVPRPGQLQQLRLLSGNKVTADSFLQERAST